MILRAFDTETKEMMFPLDFVEIDSEGRLFRDGKVLMQYTGVKDRNGKMLFSGDILSLYKGDCIIWCKECCSFQLFNSETGCWACNKEIFWDELVDDIKEIEIVGNIYENPEMFDN